MIDELKLWNLSNVCIGVSQACAAPVVCLPALIKQRITRSSGVQLIGQCFSRASISQNQHERHPRIRIIVDVAAAAAVAAATDDDFDRFAAGAALSSPRRPVMRFIGCLVTARLTRIERAKINET